MPDERILTRPFLLLMGAHFLQALGFSSMLLLPLYLDGLGASRTQVGAIMAVAAVGGLLARPVVGWGLDVLGRKPVLFAGTLVLVFGMFLVYPLEQIGPLAWVMRLLVGVGEGALFAGYFALAADIVPESRRTEGLALFGISGLMPLLVNPIAEAVGVQPSDLRWFLPAIGVLILGSLPLLLLVPEPMQQRDASQVTLRGALEAMGRRSLRPVWVATLTFAGLVSVFFAFATVAAAERGAAHPSWIWLAYAGGATGVRLLGAKLPQRLGPGKVGAAALLCYCAATALAAEGQGDAAFFTAGLLAGVGHGYCFPVLISQAVDRSPDALRGVTMAAFTGLWEVASLLVPPLFGLVADLRGDAVMLYGASGLGVLGLLLWGGLELRMGSQPPEAPLRPRGLGRGGHRGSGAASTP